MAPGNRTEQGGDIRFIRWFACLAVLLAACQGEGGVHHGDGDVDLGLTDGAAPAGDATSDTESRDGDLSERDAADILPGADADGGLDLAARRIQPYSNDPWYWQYEGVPVLLLGATDDDNLFQSDDLEPHLDDLVAAGGNYVRNTMSDRDEGDLHPFAMTGEGTFDLSQWNEAYWDRFERFLSLTHERNIVVQIEVWDRFDHSRDPWIDDPYNPENNINYTEAESGLATRYPEHPAKNLQPFFHTPPSMDDNSVVRQYQEAFVDRMLSHTFAYDHVLYVIDNETDEAAEWPTYWANWILDAADAAQVEVEITEMWDDRDIVSSDQHQYTWDHPELFSYTDISQNNHQTGDTHWDQILFVREQLSDAPMPMNSVKIYGADGGPFGTSDDGVARFWRNVLGGLATSRFHRPSAGLGLSPRASTQLRAARIVEELTPFFDLDPAHQLLGDRGDSEAYLAADPGEAYVVYFPDGGDVTIDLTQHTGTFDVIWVDLADASEGPTETMDGGSQAPLQTPSMEGWVAAIVRP